MLPQPDEHRELEAAKVGESDAQPTATRFAPVIEAAKEPPFTPYHAKYFAYELTRRVGADQFGFSCLGAERVEKLSD